MQTSDGCFLDYTLHGDPVAPHRIALVHSLALDRSLWNGVAAAIGGEASVLTFDCRGHGRSCRDCGQKFTPELFARDLAELMDHVGWPSAVVAGCSMGGNVSQAFGALYPSRALALGLIDTTAFYGTDAPAQWRERAEVAKTKGFGSMIPFQTTRWFTEAFVARHPDLLAKLNQVFLANDVDCYAAACDLLGHADLRPYLKSLTMPVTIIVGEEDLATPVAASEELHAEIQGSTLHILKGRHLTPLECPSEVAALLLEVARRPRAQAGR